MIRRSSFQILDRMKKRFSTLYGEEMTDHCLNRVSMMTGRYGVGIYGEDGYDYWDQADIYLVAYADTVLREEEPPITTLHRFLEEHLKGAVNTVHLLPFFPYSSDDGFSVIDYRAVRPELGSWENVESLAKDYSLMADLILNHVSSKSGWFKHYLQDLAPERNYFLEISPDNDLSMVVRPRAHPLLTKVHTKKGDKHVWTTFSSDQIDLDFSNPDVLFEFLDILMRYISHGVRVIRLDAIAYLWKILGSPCIHLDETHEIVKLLRDFLEMVAPQVLLLTETNVPHKENISYFGDGDEAHIVYQFSLPPLLLHGLTNENAEFLADWAKNQEPPPPNCSFLNFTASHDGIGVRPLEGLVPEEDIASLCEHTMDLGGHVSSMRNADGSESPYELNITYYDALGDKVGDSELQMARFLCSQTVALELRGIPAVYFHSLTATQNDHTAVEETGHPRSINRKKWDYDELMQRLSTEDSESARIFKEYSRLLRLRTHLKAFHPDGGQQVLDAAPDFFAVLRTSPDGSEKILAVSNFTSQEKEFDIPEDVARSNEMSNVEDKISGQLFGNTATIPFKPFQTRWIPLTPIVN